MALSSTETAEITAALAALRSALYTGARTVQFGDRSQTYQSAAEIQGVISKLERQLSARPRQTLMVASKGFGGSSGSGGAAGSL